jgi:hypothetical protein
MVFRKRRWNGIIFGAIFGMLLLLLAENVVELGFLVTFLDSISGWLMAQTWWPEWINSMKFLNYTIMALLGMILGVWIEKR